MTEGIGLAVHSRISKWLGVVSDPGLRLSEGQTAGIAFELHWDSEILKDLIAHGVETCLGAGDECRDLVDRRLFGARPRRRYGQWCLDMALAAGESKAAAFYLQELLDCMTGEIGLDGLTAEEVREQLAADEALLDQFDQLKAHGMLVEGGGNRSITSATPVAMEKKEEDTPKQRALQAQIEAQAAELRAGGGTLELLHRAAEAYLGINEDCVGTSSRQRLGDLVGTRTDLIDLLIAGLEGTIAANDLPGCEDVVRLQDRGQVNVLVLAFIAGLHSLEQAGRLSEDGLTENQTRMAVTSLYTLPRLFDVEGAVETGMYRPMWFRTVLGDSPEFVADVIRHNTALKLEAGIQQPIELHELANAEDHRKVAELISLSVLENFPKAETDIALQGLCWALNAALNNCDWITLDV